MIPKEKIEEVLDRASIVQVISEYVPLKKRGQNYLGICPFHSEKSPSFTVSEEKKIFHCFGCNASGNAVTFYMKKEGVPFPEAVRALAKRYGITIEEAKKGAPEARDFLMQALRSALDYFMEELNGPQARGAREYLKKRGYEGDIIKRFGIGYAPDKWDGLVVFLKRRGISPDDAVKAGLAVQKEKGCFDRFRNRVMFPITDVKGRVIGFGGRALGDQEPKYLNSPETTVFRKGEVLYGLFQARQGIIKEGKAIVVEGYFDLIALHKAGFTNSIATMGTALTPEHLRILKGYGATVYALFDSDEAGKNAAVRGLPLFLNEEMPCRAVILPEGKDPDEFLARKGPEGMKEAIEKAEPLMEFFLKELKRKTDLKTPEGKRKYLDGALPYLKKVKNVAEQGHYVTFLASLLGVRADSIYDLVKGDEEQAKKGVREAAGRKGTSLAELTVLRVVITRPDLYGDHVKEAIELFADAGLREAGRIIASRIRQGKPVGPAALMEEFNDEALKGMMAGLLFKDGEGFMEEPERMLEDSLKSVLNRGKIKPATRDIIKQLEDMGRTEVADEMKKRVEIAKGKKD